MSIIADVDEIVNAIRGSAWAVGIEQTLAKQPEHSAFERRKSGKAFRRFCVSVARLTGGRGFKPLFGDFRPSSSFGKKTLRRTAKPTRLHTSIAR